MGVTRRAGTVLLNQLDCLSFFKLRLLFNPLGPSNFLKTNWVNLLGSAEESSSDYPYLFD
jgi:hypothetical protein